MNNEAYSRESHHYSFSSGYYLVKSYIYTEQNDLDRYLDHDLD